MVTVWLVLRHIMLPHTLTRDIGFDVLPGCSPARSHRYHLRVGYGLNADWSLVRGL